MSQPDFRNLTALVTGASNGIGAETAVALAEHGASVLIHYNSAAAEARAVLDRINGNGAILQADLSTIDGTRHLIDQLGGRTIDILVNNAGSLIRRTPILDMTPELWDQVMMLNLTSAFFLSQAMLPGMLAKGRGVIVNVSSVAGRNGGGIGASAYATAKAAITNMTRAFTKEFAAKGIRVNAISPGTIDTNYHRTFSTDAMLNAARSATPLGRLGTPKEIADAIVFLCSPAAEFFHGQCLEANGGFLMP